MSGRKFNQAVAYPTYGSVMSHYHGFRTAMPPFIQLGTNVDRRFGGGSAGILGLEHMPFEIDADPNAAKFTVRDITPPSGVSFARIDRRQSALARLDALQRNTDVQQPAFAALDEHYKAAINMITAPETKQAFDLEKEDAKLREAYGKNRFGQSCLLSRRLIEAGVRFVTVTDGGWDTHANNFKGLKTRIPPVDKALPQLLMDLADRGMLVLGPLKLLACVSQPPSVTVTKRTPASISRRDNKQLCPKRFLPYASRSLASSFSKSNACLVSGAVIMLIAAL
jgi:hypothetical protein